MVTGLSALIFGLHVLRLACGSEVTCETTPRAREGEQASITCHFNQDKVLTEHGISVAKYDHNGTAYPEPVLDCKGIRCICNRKYKYDKTTSSTITVTIEKASKDYEGLYLCQVVPPDGTEPKPCDLILMDGDKDKQEDKENPEDDTEEKEIDLEETDEEDPGVLIVIVIGVFLIVAVAVFVAVLRRKRLREIINYFHNYLKRKRRQKGECEEQKPPESQPLN